MRKTTETRRLDRLAHSETENIARRYKVPEMAADMIDRAARIHGQKSRAIQIGVEILWRFGKFPLSVPPGAMETPIVGRTYKLPTRTITHIEALSRLTGMTQGGVLAAVAKVLAEPEPKHEPMKFAT